MKPTNNNAVIYARYSSSGQNEQSCDQQYNVCMEFAKRNKYNVVNYYHDEARTGTNDNRPDFQRMITDSRSGSFQYVIIYKIDRFARNRYDSAHYKAILKKNGVKVLSAMENISDDPTGVILESVLEGMAEHYSLNLSQNVKRGMEANAAQCLCVGGNRTLGYKIVDKKFEIDPDTEPVIKTIFEMYIKGFSPPEILQYLKDQGVKSVYGKEFRQNSVYYILTNKRYAGYYTYKGTETPGGVPAIITEEVFNQVQELIAKKKKAPARTKAAEDKYLLSGATKCGYCERSVIGVSGTGKSGSKHFYYRCSAGNYKDDKGKPHKCELKSNRKQELEDFVTEKTLELLTPERIDDIANKIVELCKKEREDNSTLAALESRLQKAQTESRNILAAVKSGKAVDTLLEELDKIEAQIKDMEREIIKESTKYPILTVDKAKFFMERFTKGDVKDFFFREKLVDTFIKKIEVLNDKITVWYTVQDGYFVEYPRVCFSSDLAGAEGLEPSKTVLETGMLPLHHAPA